MMESKYGSRRKNTSSTKIWLAAITSFVLGGALVGYVVYYNAVERSALVEAVEEPAAVEADAPSEPGADPVETPAPVLDPVETEAAQTAEAVTRVEEQQGGIDQRLAAAEQRLARLDLQAQAAANNAARSESLLIAFAARRSIERGRELGPLADQLRLRFGDSYPNAVRTIINFSRDPVRSDALLARLEGLAPQLGEKQGISSWGDLTREVGSLFVIRREGTPSPQPRKRLDRARAAIEQGRYDAAIEEIQYLPNADIASAWIADAIRFRDAMEALERIELAALDAKGVRDGAGNLVD